jgi:RNA polymerase sigma-70 factor (ECF subfamily)
VTEMPDLYRTHRARALQIARRILGDNAEAEDVVQEVFVRLWQRPGLFDGRSLWSTWLYRVMVNQSINSLRARQRRRALPALGDAPPSPEEQAVTSEMREHFSRTLKQLGGVQEQVVWMREVRGYSYPDIAERLSIPEGTVKSTLHRARARAYAMMLQLEEDPPREPA